MMSAAELGRELDKLQKISDRQALQLQPTGYLPLYAQLVPYATRSQTYSLLLAALMIALLLLWYFRSWRQMLVVLSTQAFPILGLFGLMGWLNINLDIATASIACIGLSYCVDDSIHFALNYQRHQEKKQDHHTAMIQTLAETGHAILLSSFMLLLGFGIMMFSPLKTVYLFGLLSCIMVLLALISQLVLFGMLQRRLVSRG